MRCCVSAPLAGSRLMDARTTGACHVRRTVGMRAALLTTKRLFWHCGAHTAMPSRNRRYKADSSSLPKSAVFCGTLGTTAPRWGEESHGCWGAGITGCCGGGAGAGPQTRGGRGAHAQVLVAVDPEHDAAVAAQQREDHDARGAEGGLSRGKTKTAVKRAPYVLCITLSSHHSLFGGMLEQVLLLAETVQTQFLKILQQTAKPPPLIQAGFSMGGDFLNSENKLDFRLHSLGQQ